jgi:hypothetical protein
MKKLFILLITIAIAQWSMGQVISLIYSTDQGKNCIIRITTGIVTDNKFDIDLQASWVANDMRPIKDNNSVVGFDVNQIWVSNKNYISIIGDNKEVKTICFNATKKITFEINEEFRGDSIELKFPFFYSSSSANALVAERTKFTFQRPRDYKITVVVPKGKLNDKTPPELAVLLPEGIGAGLKPIVDNPLLLVKVKATDYFGIKSVSVNNIPALALNESEYETEIPLKSGYENKILVVATDISGLSTQKEFAVECRKAEEKPIAKIEAVPKKTDNIIICDVDTAIPVNKNINELRFALIVGNEDYTSYQTDLQSEMNVDFAAHDAEIFKLYAQNVLGIPESNIIFLKNGKVIEMKKAINQLNSLIKNTKGNGEFFVYYAGHGFPDEVTKEPYIMPVDVSGSDLEFAIKLTDFYKKLSEYPSKRVTVFLDACFSGGGREMGLIAARGVKIKPKESAVNGNLVVFSASSGEQSSLPYKEKGHGMFTYYLLQKMKETRGNISYAELADYLSTTVGIRSVIVNNKEQNPQANISPEIVGKWKTWTLNGN